MSDVEPPKLCGGCGLHRAVDADNPATHETTFEVADELGDDSCVPYECQTCGVRTYIERDPEPSVECRTCGRSIPESLQGNHVCESHPLGLAAEPARENPMEDYR